MHVRMQIDSTGLPRLNVSIPLYTLLMHAMVQIDSTALPTLNIASALYMLWKRARLQIDSIRFRQLWRHWIAHIERFSCILYTLEGCQATD